MFLQFVGVYAKRLRGRSSSISMIRLKSSVKSLIAVKLGWNKRSDCILRMVSCKCRGRSMGLNSPAWVRKFNSVCTILGNMWSSAACR